MIKSKKIYYALRIKDNVTRYITDCPYNKKENFYKVKVDSIVCKYCKHYIATNKEKQFILCKYPKYD